MQTDTGKATRVISEGRHKASGAVSVAWLTDTGPRDENQDRAVARLHDDSSWLVAVADGMGGHPRGRDASKTAIKALPRLVDTQEAMYQAFKAAHETVFKLAPKYARYSRHEVRKCPASTLCVAAWTPAGGLLVGIAGDTRPVVLWRDDDSWHGRTLGRLHRNISIYGYITKYLGAPRSWPAMGANDRDPHGHIRRRRHRPARRPDCDRRSHRLRRCLGTARTRGLRGQSETSGPGRQSNRSLRHP